MPQPCRSEQPKRLRHHVCEARWQAERTLAAPQEWSTLRLKRDEQDILADAAHVLRFCDNEGETKTPIKSEQFLIPRRHDDRADDLWTVWNVVQENAIKGGLRGAGRDGLGRPRRVKSRAVNGFDQDIKLNKALWLLGERMAALKS
ncbi:DUF932 domain-containing protein [Rhizobium sp. SL42]|uniref:DUF932 domain-containing protein n=1 Tax=Rhizobium sp. SL42 TaxID=2806346 RepID=UPI001F207962|nr:DUF932 domain-containing protein [Rhizobium sp. SL42]